MANLDLPKQFDLLAKTMVLAVGAGRLSHGAGNIKAAGAPLEVSFRKLLIDSLPSSNKVTDGYFYGANSDCSGEIDVLVYEDKEAFRLDPPSQAQHYVPYTSVSILGQIKNSARDLGGAIDQSQKAISSWKKMKSEMALTNASLGGPIQHEPLTFIVCGECKDSAYKKIRKILQLKGRPFVDYILFLDRGEIVAGDYSFFDSDPHIIDFQRFNSVDSLYLCKPAVTAYQQGVALLWLYFALVSKLNLDQGNNLRYRSFCNQISNLYQLHAYQKLL